MKSGTQKPEAQGGTPVFVISKPNPNPTQPEFWLLLHKKPGNPKENPDFFDTWTQHLLPDRLHHYNVFKSVDFSFRGKNSEATLIKLGTLFYRF